MPQCCSISEVVLYADDTTITSCSVNENTQFSSDVKNVKKWFDQNCLTINENKCMIMLFGRNKKAKYLDSVSKDVQIKDQCKYLGNNFDKLMKFTYHCKKDAKKIATFSGVAYRARNYFTKNQLLIFYNAYVKSTMEYGLLIYGNTYKTHLDEIYKMQKIICKAIFFKRKTDVIRNIMTKYHLLTVYEVFANNIFKFMFDELRKPESTYLKLDSLSNHCETRRVSHKLLPVPNSKNIKNSLRIKVIVAYNFE